MNPIPFFHFLCRSYGVKYKPCPCHSLEVKWGRGGVTICLVTQWRAPLDDCTWFRKASDNEIRLYCHWTRKEDNIRLQLIITDKRKTSLHDKSCRKKNRSACATGHCDSFNPLPPRRDWHVTSPYNINTFFSKQVMRIPKLIGHKILPWLNTKFS